MVPDPLPPALVLSSPDWHEGVVGIVASRVAEQCGRPVILLSESDDEAKGSGRSIPGFDLLGAVQTGSAAPAGLRRPPRGVRPAPAPRDASPRFREAFDGCGRGRAHRRPAGAHAARRRRGRAATTSRSALADELELLAPHGARQPARSRCCCTTPQIVRAAPHAQTKSTCSTSVRCDGASCSAIHFNFSAIAEVSARARYDVPLALRQERLQRRRERAGAGRAACTASPDDVPDLCAGPCAFDCRRRLRGEALWRYLLDGALCRGGGPRPGRRRRPPCGGRRAGRAPPAWRPAACRTAAAAPWCRRSRRWPPAGERVLVLVADVARRRPLLSRDVLPAPLGRRRHVPAGRLRRAPGRGCWQRPGRGHGRRPTWSPTTRSWRPPSRTWRSSTRPFTKRLLGRPRRGRAAGLAPCAVGRAAEVDFAGRSCEAELDLEAVVAAHVARPAAGDGLFHERLEQELLGEEYVPAVGRRARRGAAHAARGRSAAHGRRWGTGWSTAAGQGRPHHHRDVSRDGTTDFRRATILRTCLTAPL